jgi:hypothetical protein
MSGIFFDGSWLLSLGLNSCRLGTARVLADSWVFALVSAGWPGVVVLQPASTTMATPSRIRGMRTLLTPFRHVDSTGRFVQVERCYLDFAK